MRSIWRVCRSQIASDKWRPLWNKTVPRCALPREPIGWSWPPGWSCSGPGCCFRRRARRRASGKPERISRLTTRRRCRQRRPSRLGSNAGHSWVSMYWPAAGRRWSEPKSAPGTMSMSSNSSGPAWHNSTTGRTAKKPSPSIVRPGSAYGPCWTPASASCSFWQTHRRTRRSIGSCRKRQPEPRSKPRKVSRCSGDLAWPAL